MIIKVTTYIVKYCCCVVHPNAHTKTIYKIQLLCHRICCNFFSSAWCARPGPRSERRNEHLLCCGGLLVWVERCKMLPGDALDWRTRHLGIHQRFQTRKVQTQRNAASGLIWLIMHKNTGRSLNSYWHLLRYALRKNKVKILSQSKCHWFQWNFNAPRFALVAAAAPHSAIFLIKIS